MSMTVLRQIQQIRALIKHLDERIEFWQAARAREVANFHPRRPFIIRCDRQIRVLTPRKHIQQRRLDKIDRI